MLLPRFTYHDPDTLEAACRAVAELGRSAKLLAGGTDLIVHMKRKTISPEHVISLSKVGQLKGIHVAHGTARIGACVTAAEIAGSQPIRKGFFALAMGAGNLGSPLIRNLATIGGNLATARPAADTATPLLAYDAKLVLYRLSGVRTVPITGFFTGPGETVLAPDEILTEVVLERPHQGRTGSGHGKLGVRNTLEIALVNVAAFLCLEGNVVTEARVALGSVAPTPILSPSAANVLRGEKPSPGLFVRAAEAAASDSRPIDDFRASAEYKRAMAEVLARRALAQAYQNAVNG